MLIRTLLCSLVIITVISISNAQNSCRTPGGTVGLCVLIENCPGLYAVSQKQPQTANDRNILSASQCGSQGTSSKVCCKDSQESNDPAPCRTPDNNAPGTCISLKSCRYLYRLLFQKPMSQASVRLLQNSKCGMVDERTPKVCCSNTPPVDPVTQPPLFIPEIDTGTGVTPKSSLLPTYDQCGAEQTVDKLVGGNVTDLLEFPWMVLLQYQNRAGERVFACGGTIISKRYVLTAAHCLKGNVLKVVGTLVNVRVGEYDTSRAEDCVINQGCNTGYTTDVGVEEGIPHPGWNQGDPAQLNDIALVRLNRDLSFNAFVQPICLPNKGLEPTKDDIIFVAGWGRTESNVNSNVKLKLKIPMLPIQNCQTPYQKLLSNLRLSDPLQFCAGGEPGKDSCKGDSGGPAMKLHPDQNEGKVVWMSMGVISFGPDPCGTAGLPGIYTKVSSHINWLLSNMRPQTNKTYLILKLTDKALKIHFL